MNDALLMRVLNGVADLREEGEALTRGQIVLVAILCDGNAPYQLHHEVRPAPVGHTGVEDLGNVWMIHQRQRLTLGLETSDHLLGVYAQLESNVQPWFLTHRRLGAEH